MSQVKTYHLVEKQVPDFLLADSPKFVEFLQAYYKFLEDTRIDIHNVKDVDLSPDELLIVLKQEFMSKFPNAVIDDRKLISLARSLYKKKGTVSAIELLFRIFFNEAITIQQPNKSILRASDGVWYQESSIMLTTVYGTFDMDAAITLRIENTKGVFYVPVETVKQLDENRFVFTFKSTRVFLYDENQAVDITNADGTEIIYRGTMTRSASRLNVLGGGKAWKAGQVFKIPGTIEPTIARAVSVSPTGSLISAEIISYGYDHSENSVVLLSPYPNKPAGAEYTLDFTLVDYDPLTETYTYNYDIGFADYVDVATERIFGLIDSINSNSYFLEDYVQQGYTGYLFMDVLTESQSISTENILGNPDITLEDWFESRAAIEVKFDYVIRQRGYYLGNEGQISNQEIRVQDNYFYQLFSYVIETSNKIEDYRNVLNLFHPAGMKFFANLTKTVVIDEASVEDIDVSIDS